MDILTLRPYILTMGRENKQGDTKMAKRMTDREKSRVEAEKLQRSFDAAVRKFESESWMPGTGLDPAGVAYATVYDVVFEEALVEDAGRTHGRLMDAMQTLEFRAQFSENMVERWQADLAKNASHAFEWSNEVAVAAHTAWVLRQAHDLLGNYGPAALLKAANYEVMRGARWPSHSTSPSANVAAEAKTAAWADLVADLGDTLKKLS